MKKLFLFLLGSILGSSILGQQTWTLDNAHSNIRFEVGWQDFSVRTGEFKIFEGSIATDSINDLTRAVFQLKVDPASIDVIADRLAEQLKGERFLDVVKFPEITFNSLHVREVSDSTYIATGKLSIHGVEKDQEVYVRFKGQTKGSRAYIKGIEASLSLNRKDFGLDWGSPRLGETVKIIGHLLYQMRITEE